MLQRFTSRKFLAAAVAFTVAILAATGVIDQAQEVIVGESLAPLLYILVEGILDWKSR